MLPAARGTCITVEHTSENYSTNFKIFKQALMQKACPKASHKENAAVEKLADSLADNFDINELRRAIRETKKTFFAWRRQSFL